ncbi:MAG: tRNA 2-thiouridine(34) synthase MnmA [Bacillota bacterium]|nr:tRNA 2-thiouridine(34) synthase MnmA [Bacillota bacterium]
MKVAVLMSGGVDSTITAHLLKEQGYELMGLTMINWDDSIGEKAARAAKELGIEHRIVDLRDAFNEKVIEPFCKSYESAKTPNPCVACNNYIKFGILLEQALQSGCEKIATGHFVQVEYDALRDRYLLKKGIDLKKDQSYFLYGLTQQQLARVIFPLGNWTKEEVKDFAMSKGIVKEELKESQEICFIANDYREFILPRVKARKGEFIDQEEKVLGMHKGVPFYTIGQRKGLGISGGRPLYVLDMDIHNNTVLLGDNEELFKDTLFANDINYILESQINEPIRVQAKIRYAAKPTWATVTPFEQGKLKVVFDEPQRAITPGQAVVFYQNDYVLGGATIFK